ncbi:MAG: phosphoribosylformylglycinamidine synthase subunit PurL [Acidimicrobiales bacterium]
MKLQAEADAEPSAGKPPTPELHRALGLTDEEVAAIAAALGREPNHLELAMYAVMWSEHCSYKSSRVHLRRLPSAGPHVLVGPGENAGVIDAGDGVAVALRIESHNHPSAIEPYQGAATGVGGILRDIFTMGARPIALLDSLRMGPLDDPHCRWIFEGVVSGISGYGNAVGVPTVGGELVFDGCYAGNPLVNVMCVGVLPTSRLVLSAASGVGNLAVLLGSLTGRDGIGGVSVLASAAFGRPAGAAGDGTAGDGATGDGATGDEGKRPSVQVGDPYEEKRLIEACLELLDQGLVVAIQDLGGAGLSCATSETAARGGLGMDVNVAAVPRREPEMQAFEVMTSESQERMLAIVRPDDLAMLAEVCERWEVRATEIGRVTEGGLLRILDGWDGEVLAEIPAASLADQAPLYLRPLAPPTDLADTRADDPAGLQSDDCGKDLLAMLADPSWVYRQYDHQLFLNTVIGPGDDAAVLRLAAPGLAPTTGAPTIGAPTTGAPTGKGIALTTDGNGRWCAVDPRRGTAMVVAEATLNLACVGASPAAVVDCLNFGNPEHPEVMWQLSEAIDGMAEACTALNVPVVGGNVSLYNESAGVDIDPTPVVGALGLIDALDRPPPGARLVAGASLLLLGVTRPGLAGSRWATQIKGYRGGQLDQVDFEAHAKLAELVSGLVAAEMASSGRHTQVVLGVHDVSDGGLGTALAEMAVRSGIGLRISGIASHAELFSESPSRVVVCTGLPGAVAAAAAAAGVPCVRMGSAGGARIVVEGLLDLPMEAAIAAWKGSLADAMGRGPRE